MTAGSFIASVHLDELVRALRLPGRRIWLYLAGMLGHCAMYSLGQVGVAYANKYVVNAAAEGDPRLLLVAVCLRGVVLLMSAGLYPAFVCLAENSLRRTLSNLRLSFYRHLEALPRAYFDSHHSGDTLSLFANDSWQFEEIYRSHLPEVTDALVWGVTSAVALLALEWRLSVLVILLGLLSAVLMARFSGPLRILGDRMQSSLSRLTQITSDILRGFPTLKAYGLQDRLTEKYAREHEVFRHLSLQKSHTQGAMGAVNELLAKLNLLGLFLVGALLAISGVTDAGTVAAAVTLQAGVAFMFTRLGAFFSGLQRSLAASERLFRFLDIPPEPERYTMRTSAVPLPSEYAVELRGVTFAYRNGPQALRDIHLSIGRGQSVALVGENGSGKSTVFRLLLGLYAPSEGEVHLFGRALDSLALTELRQMMGYVPQEPCLFDGTIDQNIRLGRPGAAESDVVAAAKAAGAHDFISRLPARYDSAVGEKGMRLSGGQRQLVAIARALLKDAPILLLDEATSAVDGESEERMAQALQILMKGRTTIVIAHRVSTARRADWVCVMENGRIIQEGTALDVLRSRSGPGRLSPYFVG